jgi:hypothetical protein
LQPTAGIAEGREFLFFQPSCGYLLKPEIIVFRQMPFRTVSAFVEID